MNEQDILNEKKRELINEYGSDNEHYETEVCEDE